MQEWYVHDKGATTGPFTTEQVKESLAGGKIGESATFCLSGTTTWRQLRDLPELAVKKTELPVVANDGCETVCRSCECPVGRVLKKAIVLAVLAAVAWFLFLKLGHFHHVRPL